MMHPHLPLNTLSLVLATLDCLSAAIHRPVATTAVLGQTLAEGKAFSIMTFPFCMERHA